MKGISIRQPWAWLIAKGIKDVENRSWKTEYRGRVYIHAGKVFDEEGYRWLLRNSELSRQLLTASNIFHGRYFRRALGAIIGEVDIVDCVTESDSQWFSGPYGFVLTNPVMYGEPIPCKGQLGFFEVRGTETEYSKTFRDK